MPLPRYALILLALLLTACSSVPPRTASPLSGLHMDNPSDLLFWTPEQREAAFRAMDRIVTHRPVTASSHPHPLPQGEPLSFDPDAFMREYRTAGLLVLQNGKIRLERYGLGFTPEERWTSFSVAKSVTSTLVGIAIAEGYIESLETPIVRYLPELAGSAYDTVTVRQLLTMTSGANWNEDYEDPNSDVARFFGERSVPAGADPTLDYMRQLKQAAAPGTRWHYSTGETSLVGVLVSRTTGKTLADYLSQSIWQPYGMEKDAAWMVDESGQEPGGCCLIATLRDWGRVAQFILDKGVIGQQSRVPENWFAEATRNQVDTGIPGLGYGFQWWTLDHGRFEAHGIFGQFIYIDPENQLAIVILSAWPTATSRKAVKARHALIASLRDAALQ